jgi:hypothetical protein
MTETLADKTCTPCRGGVPPLAREEALRLQSQAPDWELRDDARRIERTFRFRNFQGALVFVQQVGELAESRNADDFSWAYSRRRSYCVLAANIRLPIFAKSGMLSGSDRAPSFFWSPNPR